MSSSGNYHLVWNDAVRQATAPFEYCPSTASISVRPHCPNASQNICQLSLEELEKTTTMPLYYVDEDYPARPEIQ